MGVMFSENMGKNLAKSASSAGEWFGEIGNTMGNKVSKFAGNAVEALQNPYGDDKDAYVKDAVAKQSALFKENFGKDPSKDQTSAFTEKAEGLFKEGEQQADIRKRLLGGALGGIAGGLMHNPNQKSTASRAGSMGSASGGGSLGTGYNPFARR